MNETERWVQCSKCSKWRCVPDTLKIDMNLAWECKYNVFDPKHNNCSHEQEKMPEEEADEEEPNLLDFMQDINNDNELEIVPEEESGLFKPSTCKCSLCTEINQSVLQWESLKGKKNPLLNSLINAIEATEPMAVSSEDDKQFKLGVTLSLKPSM